MAVSANLSLTVAHAISFLTRPLIVSYPAAAIIKLQLTLEANLIALFEPSWVVKEPLRSSGRRCLTLSPSCLPPRAIYSACVAAGVQWFDWIALLGGREFDLFVDPGRVSIRYGRKHAPNSEFITIWADEGTSCVATDARYHSQTFDQSQATPRPFKCQSKTLAQQLLEDDHEDDDQLFAMIADEIRAPTWMTPVREHFVVPSRSLSPLSTISDHSRSSSRSSNSSSGFSFDSFESSGSATSVSTSSTRPDAKYAKQSRRERARQARVFVDTSKTDVTPYDGGKTTVLTGGVMLGGVPNAGRPKKEARPTNVSASSWRPTRA